MLALFAVCPVATLVLVGAAPAVALGSDSNERTQRRMGVQHSPFDTGIGLAVPARYTYVQDFWT